MAFSKQDIAVRIAIVSVVMAAVASPVAWYIARENAEEQLVDFAGYQSRRVTAYHANTKRA